MTTEDYNEDEAIEEDSFEEDDKNPKAAAKEVFSWILTIGLAVICGVLLNQFVVLSAYVPTSSMEGTIRERDRVIAFRLSYLFSTPERFDIIVFPSPVEEDTLNVKRVIGLGGETVNIVQGRVYINDDPTPLRNDFVGNELLHDFGPFEVPEGHVFVLGDYRANSRDSRWWRDPYINVDDILGRVAFRFFPGFSTFRLR